MEAAAARIAWAAPRSLRTQAKHTRVCRAKQKEGQQPIALLSADARSLFESVATDQRNRSGRLLAAYTHRLLECAQRHKNPAVKTKKNAQETRLPPPSVVCAFVDYFGQSLAFDYGIMTTEEAEVQAQGSGAGEEGAAAGREKSFSPREVAASLDLLVEGCVFRRISAVTGAYECQLLARKDRYWHSQVAWARRLSPTQVGIPPMYVPQRRDGYMNMPRAKNPLSSR